MASFVRAADRAWLAMAGGIVLYEALAKEDELLSSGWDRYVAHPNKKVARIAAATPFLVAAHLSNVLDPRFDPISLLFKLMHWLFGKK